MRAAGGCLGAGVAGAAQRHQPAFAHLCLHATTPSLSAAIKGGLEYALRVAFGTALIVSVVAVWVAITAISSSNSRDDNRRNNSGGGVYYGGGPRMMFDLTDLLWYWCAGCRLHAGPAACQLPTAARMRRCARLQRPRPLPLTCRPAAAARPPASRRDPFYFRHRRERMRQQGLKGQGMNFLEAIFR